VKLLVAIVSDDDVRTLLSALMKAGHRATRLASTGGFLRKGNTTLLLGVKDSDVNKVLQILRQTCRRRTEPYPVSIGEHPTIIPQETVEVEVGGATVFILPIERFVHM
jgi:uncharacterized protein YaaQ